MSKEEKKKYVKSRYWTCVLYPESCKENFREILNKEFISWICSPLHDQDINELDNEKKKSHYHLIFWFSENGSTTLNVATELAKKIGGVEFVQPVHALANCIKYLIHLNNPEKAQYKKSDITYSADVDLDEYFKLTKTDERLLSFEIIDFIKNQCVVEYCDFVYWCRENDKYEWYDYIKDNAFYINLIIKSQRHSIEKKRG